MWSLKFIIFVSCGIIVYADKLDYEVIEESEIDRGMSENIVLYGLLSELVPQKADVSVKCAADLTNIFRGINNKVLWAIKVMDASGNYRGSFVWGQNAWIGSKQSCDYLNKAPKFTLSPDIPKLMDPHLISTISPIEMEFKMVFTVAISPYKIDPLIHLDTAYTHRLGLCLPKSCSDNDIELLSTRFFSQKKLKFQNLFNATIDVIKVRNMDIQNFLSQPKVGKIFLAICAVITLVVAFSVANSIVEKTKLNELKRFTKCFSIYDNITSIYKTHSSPNSIKSIDGLRTIICLWVVFVHCGFFSMYAYDNLPELIASLERIETQPILALTMYVDTFFVLSSLLLVFNFLKDERTLSEIKDNCIARNVTLFLKKIVHRYIRLTPAFLFAIGIGQLVSVYVQESSSLYIDETFDVYCSANGAWKSIFYIHNLPDGTKDVCLNWTWYLACDMQFYIVILFVLFIHTRYPSTAKTMFLLLLLALTAVVIYVNLDLNVLPRLDSTFYHSFNFYAAPWNRMHPYLAGCTIGYVMFRIKDREFPENRYITITFCSIMIPCMVASMFLTAFKEISVLNFAIAMSVGRFVFGLFVGLSIVMFRVGYGGIVNTILSNRLFVHMGKVTYCIFLMHPILVLYFTATQESSPHFDGSSLTLLSIGVIAVTYAFAVVMSAIVEIPFQKLSDEYVINKSKTKKSTIRE